MQKSLWKTTKPTQDEENNMVTIRTIVNGFEVGTWLGAVAMVEIFPTKKKVPAFKIFSAHENYYLAFSKEDAEMMQPNLPRGYQAREKENMIWLNIDKA